MVQEEAPDVPVVSIINRPPIVFRPEDPVVEAVRRMAEENVGSVVVVDEEMRPVGIFTERDLLRLCAQGVDLSKTRLGDVMTKNPTVIREDESVRKALEIMLYFGFRHLPVVDAQGRLVGVVSIRDVTRPFAGEVDVEELHSAG